MSENRGAIPVETLLKIVLVLVVALLVIEVVGVLVSGLLALLRPFFLLAIVAVIVLWLLGRI
jgi:hypothetical protein